MTEFSLQNKFKFLKSKNIKLKPNINSIMMKLTSKDLKNLKSLSKKLSSSESKRNRKKIKLFGTSLKGLYVAKELTN